MNPETLIDLTQRLRPGIPAWDDDCGFRLETLSDYGDFKGPARFRIQNLHLPAAAGTHLDAPAHCFAGGADIASLPWRLLVAPCVMIDVSARGTEEFSLSPEDVAAFERESGKIPRGAWVLVGTGWDRHWEHPEAYRNGHRFPAVSEGAAQLFVERGCVGLGVDTLSPDRVGEGFPAHRTLLGNGALILENLTNLRRIPPTGAHLAVLPLKIEGGAEAPARAVAWVE